MALFGNSEDKKKQKKLDELDEKINYHLLIKNYIEVINLCDEAILINNTESKFWSYKAKALFETNQVDNAIILYQKVLSLNPSDSSALLGLKKCEELKNQLIKEDTSDELADTINIDKPENNDITIKKEELKKEISKEEASNELADTISIEKQENNDITIAKNDIIQKEVEETQFILPNDDQTKTIAIDLEKSLVQIDENDFQRKEELSNLTNSLNWQNGDIVENIYLIQKVLGVGGMGKVYLAKHLKWNIDIAIKLILPDRFDENGLMLFIKEADLWINLFKHPHIATAYYVRKINNIPAIFVEYVSGGTLNDWIEKNKSGSIKNKLNIALQFCEGMIYAHDKGLIHRDIKPLNVLISSDGNVKITDFGLAKSSIDSDEEQSGAGTPFYMPPEQWDSISNTDKRSDIYSFGVMLYEIFTNKKPFEIKEDDNRHPTFAFMEMHKNDIPESPITHNNEINNELNNLILKCLEKKPEKRYQEFKEVYEELQTIYQAHSNEAFNSVKYNSEELISDDLNNRALSLIDIGLIDKAKSLFEKALEVDVSNFYANINLANFMWEQGYITGEHEKLFLYIDRALEINLEEGYYYRALLKRNTGYIDEAISNIEVLIDKGINKAEIYNLKGICHLTKNEYELALECFTNAAKINPDSAGYLWNHGIVQLLKDDKTKSVKCFNESKTINAQLEEELISKNDDALWKVTKTDILEDKFNGINRLDFASNSKLVISSDPNTDMKKILIWDIKSEQRIHEINVDINEGIKTSLISPDSNFAILLGDNGGLYKISIPEGEIINKSISNKNKFSIIKCSPDGKYFAVKGDDRIISLWDVEKFEEIKSWEKKGHVNAIAFSNDNSTLAACCADKVVIWDLKALKEIKILEDAVQSQKCLLFSNDSNLLISAGGYDSAEYTDKDLNIRIWDSKTYKLNAVLQGHSDVIHSLVNSPDNKYLISGSNDSTIRFWNLSTKKCEKVVKADNTSIKSISFSDNKRIFSTEDFDWEYTYLSDIGKPLFIEEPDYLLTRISSVEEDIKIKNEFDGIVQSANSLFVSKNYSDSLKKLLKAKSLAPFRRDIDANLIFGKLNRIGIKKSLKLGYLIKSLPLDFNTENAAELMPIGNSAIIGKQILNINNKEFENELIGHKSTITAVCISPDGRFAITGSTDQTIILWDLKKFKSVYQFNVEEKFHKETIASLCISPDCTSFFSGSIDQSIIKWNLSEFKPEKKFETQTIRANILKINPQNNYLYYADRDDIMEERRAGNDNDKFIYILDTNKAELVDKLSGHNNTITAFEISQDGSIGLSASQDKTLKIWDLKNNTCINTIENLDDVIFSISITSDNKFAFLAGGGGRNWFGSYGGRTMAAGEYSIQIWDLNQGKLVKKLIDHSNNIKSILLTNDNRYLISASMDHTLKLWELEWNLDFNTTHDIKEDKENYFKVNLDGVRNVKANVDEAKISENEIRKAIRLGIKRTLMADNDPEDTSMTELIEMMTDRYISSCEYDHLLLLKKHVDKGGSLKDDEVEKALMDMESVVDKVNKDLNISKLQDAKNLILKGEKYLEGNQREALKLFEQALDKGNQLNEDAIIFMASHGIGSVYAQLQQFEKALEYFQIVIDLSPKLSNKIKANEINEAVLNLDEFNNYEATGEMFYKLAQEAVKQEGEGDRFFNTLKKASTFIKAKQMTEAIPLLLEAIKIAENENNLQNKLYAVRLLPSCYFATGELDKVSEFIDLTLELSKQLNDNESPGFVNFLADVIKNAKGNQKADVLPSSKDNIKKGQLAINNKDFKLAIEYLEPERAAFDKLDNPKMQFDFYVMLGVSYMNLSEIDKCEECSNKISKHAKASKDPNLIEQAKAVATRVSNLKELAALGKKMNEIVGQSTEKNAKKSVKELYKIRERVQQIGVLQDLQTLDLMIKLVEAKGNLLK